jgi:hypothetical protein
MGVKGASRGGGGIISTVNSAEYIKMPPRKGGSLYLLFNRKLA